MLMRDGTNTISEARYQAAREEMRVGHSDDYERAAAGRTEELPREMRARHANEERRMERDRDTMSVAEWRRNYPDTERTRFMEAHSKIDNEIIRGLHQANAGRQIDRREAAAAFVQAQVSDGRSLQKSNSETITASEKQAPHQRMR